MFLFKEYFKEHSCCGSCKRNSESNTANDDAVSSSSTSEVPKSSDGDGAEKPSQTTDVSPPPSEPATSPDSGSSGFDQDVLGLNDDAHEHDDSFNPFYDFSTSMEEIESEIEDKKVEEWLGLTFGFLCAILLLGCLLIPGFATECYRSICCCWCFRPRINRQYERL